jgi:type II secretory pathway pseudopilin PulG
MAAERAYARRAQRAELLQRDHDAEPAERKTTRRLRWPASRASFVVMMMGLLAAGVAATLWLSTQAIADSYRLEQLRAFNARQAEQAQQLQRQVTQEESASALAQKAKALGMVPGGDPARILVNPDGSTTLVGQPKKAQGAKPAPAPAPAAGTQPVQGAPIEGDLPAVSDQPAAGDQ